MSQQEPEEINRLIGEFVDLQEDWEHDSGDSAADAHFDWNALQALARRGAQAYNEGAGPSFHALALDGMQHNAFHERFLDDLLQAGFDPFKLTSTGAGYRPETAAAVPVIDHASLAEAAAVNPSSARMRAVLMEQARARFEPLAKDIESGRPASALPLFDIARECAESIPRDLLQRIAPELVPPEREAGDSQKANPLEGYLTPAELQVEANQRPYG